MAELSRRWRASGHLVSLELTLGVGTTSVAMLALGLIGGDRPALLIGEISTVFASAMVAMSIFAKLTRGRPVKVHRGPWRVSLARYSGILGVTGFTYAGVSFGLYGGQGLYLAALGSYSFLLAIISLELLALRRGPFRPHNQKRKGWVTLAFGTVLLVLMVAALVTVSTTPLDFVSRLTVLIPINLGIFLDAWMKLRGSRLAPLLIDPAEPDGP